MSALAGLWSISAQTEASSCAAMLAVQGAYGPDRSDLRSLGPITMGRNLFALVPEDDFDGQPLIGGEGRFLLVADVRLDNRAELSSALTLGSSARTMADSAILLRALERWGETAPLHLLGDYAFAWFDLHEGRLFLARDPLGQRPLFWHRGHDSIAFSSMPAGLRVLNGVERYPDEDASIRFLANYQRLPTQSFFSGIERVPPGHTVSLTRPGTAIRRYWQPQRNRLELPKLEDYVEAYRTELERAVRSRLRTNAPVVATHLSGGWDSGAVAATAAQIHSGPIVAFTAVPRTDRPTQAPRNRFADEGPVAAAVAAIHPNIEHELIQSDGASPLDCLEEGVRWFERPLFNLCNHGWLRQIRQAARQRGAQVLLTGEIGNWTISAAPIDLLADHLRSRRWGLWWTTANALRDNQQARWRGILASSLQPWAPNTLWHVLGRISSHPQMRPALRPEIWKSLNGQPNRHRSDTFEKSVEALSNMDFGEYRKGILGGWGIDKRDASSDIRLIEFCLSLPPELLLNGHGRRPLARAALSDRLPRAVLDSAGKGYQAADWHIRLTRDLPRAEALISAIAQNAAASSIIDTGRLRGLLRSWPKDNVNSPMSIALYRNVFLQSLTAGHFLVRTSGGSLR